jgi:putative ABC transport system substrate-binding protein
MTIRNPVLLLMLVAWVATMGVGEESCAQQITVRRIAVVAPGFSVDSGEAQAFREGLHAAGYVEGRDLSIDWWFGHGSYDGVADAVARFVRSKVDVIVVESTVAALAAQRATKTVPIVMALVGDPEALANEGVLISYATQSTALFQRAAGYVDKILKGASPATLPVEQPTQFELVINLKTAKALGLAIPESVLLQADEVIK